MDGAGIPQFIGGLVMEEMGMKIEEIAQSQANAEMMPAVRLWHQLLFRIYS